MFDLGLTASDFKRIAWSAVFAFVGVYASLVAGLGEFGSWEATKAAAAALLPAALAAAFSAIKNGVLADGSALKG
jgi:hypothetical protein